MNHLTEEQKLQLQITFSALSNDEETIYSGCLEYIHKHSFQPLYEALLQLHLFAGYPCALTALSILYKAFKELYPDAVLNESIENDESDFILLKEKGIRTCELIYTKSYAPLMAKIKEFSPQLQEWMVVDGYGKTLSRKDLSIADREILIVAVLTKQGWKKQLYSHIRGAKNVGCTKEILDELLEFGNEFFSVEERHIAKEIIDTIYN